MPLSLTPPPPPYSFLQKPLTGSYYLLTPYYSNLQKPLTSPLPIVCWRILVANLSRLFVAFMLAPN